MLSSKFSFALPTDSDRLISESQEAKEEEACSQGCCERCPTTNLPHQAVDQEGTKDVGHHSESEEKSDDDEEKKEKHPSDGVRSKRKADASDVEEDTPDPRAEWPLVCRVGRPLGHDRAHVAYYALACRGGVAVANDGSGTTHVRC